MMRVGSFGWLPLKPLYRLPIAVIRIHATASHAPAPARAIALSSESAARAVILERDKAEQRNAKSEVTHSDIRERETRAPRQSGEQAISSQATRQPPRHVEFSIPNAFSTAMAPRSCTNWL